MNEAQNPTTELNILSLEDSIMDFDLIREHLIHSGFNVSMERVETEKEYQSCISNQTYDLILADYNLPSYDAFKALALRNKICPQVPFICVSGSIGEDMAIELLKQGAVDYVLKHKLERLPLTIKRALEESRQKKEKELAEEALRKSEERLRDILFSTADWVWEIDENGFYTYSSIKGNELFETSQEDIIGKTPFNFMPPEEAERVGKIFLELVAQRVPIRNLENWNIAKNGNRICMLTNGVPIFDKDGNFRGYRGVDINITDQKLAEEVIRQSEAELNHAQKIASMGSWVLNMLTNKYTWSQNMYPILGYDLPDKEVTLEDFTINIHPDDKYLIDVHLNKMIVTRNGADVEFRYLLPNGEIIWLRSISTPRFEHEKLIELLGVTIDITDKKKSEQELMRAKEKAEASDELKTAFLNNISHEIRTPLNGILGFAPLVIDPVSTQEEKENYLEILNVSSKRLMQTVTDYMDASLIASGNIEPRNRTFAPDEVLNEIEKEFHNPCKSKGLEFRIEKPIAFKDALCNSDVTLLKKILSHLLDNAIKFTKHGRILLKATVNGDSLEIAVKDSGVGIKEEVMEEVFKHFVQEEISNTRGHEGSGLGLSIVNGLVKLLGGTIRAESVKGTGSTFTVTIPGITTTGEKYIKPAPILPKYGNSTPMILVAEDDPGSYLFIELMLNTNFRILRAEEGQEAVDMCKEIPEIQLVLMDIKMPGMNGLEATRIIKKIRKDLPIIALTAYAETGMRDKCLDAGCDDYISKPVERNLLYSVLSKFGFYTLGKK